MKRTLTAVLLLCVFINFGHAQMRLQKADYAYEHLLYVRAASLYEKITKSKHNSPEIRLRLANSYYHMGNSKQAHNVYKTVNLESFGEHDLYNYMHTEKMMHNRKKAEEISVFLCEKFNAVYCREPVIDEQIAYFNLEESGLNTANNNDFGGYPINETEILFLSDRATNKVIGKKNGYNNYGFFSFYKAEKTETNTYSKPQKMHGKARSKFHEGPLCFTTDGKGVYFSRNEKQTSDAQLHHIAIYHATISRKGKWKNVRKLSINSPDYSSTHPALTPDGKKMIFSSDMKNGHGGFDLYSGDILENGDVDNVRNLGQLINTSRNELFAYIDAQGYLYFASDGHAGFGGLDNFIAKMDDSLPIKIMNAGANINSPQDDFAFIFNSETKTGYVSSNRKGIDNIYSIYMIDEPMTGSTISGKILNFETKKQIEDAVIEITSENQTDKLTVTSDSVGFYSITLPKEWTERPDHEQKYTLHVQKTRFQTQHVEFSKLKGDTTQNIELYELKNGDMLHDIMVYFDRGSAELTLETKQNLQKVISMINEYPNMKIEVAAHTDCTSSSAFNLRLSKRRANATVKYIREQLNNPQQIYGKGYGKSKPIVACSCQQKASNPCSIEALQMNRRAEFIIKKM